MNRGAKTGLVILTDILLLIIISLGESKAQDRIPVRFPLGITAGISRDSVKFLLKGLGSINENLSLRLKPDLCGNLNQDLEFGPLSLGAIVFNIDDSLGLYAVRFGEGNGRGCAEVKDHYRRIMEVGQFLEGAYLGHITIKKVVDGADLMGEEVIELQGTGYSLTVFSLYTENQGLFSLLVSYYDDTLFKRISDREIAEEQKKMQKQKLKL